MATPRRYFGGNRVSPAQVFQLSADTFHQLVERYYGIPAPIAMTRQEFLAHPDRDKIKDGPYVCACSFKETPCQRKDEHADALNTVILDLDDSTAVLPIFEDPQALSEAIWPWNFVLYTTAKHTPEAPRMKLVVDVEDGTPVTWHRPMVAVIVDKLGLPRSFKGNVESRTLSQPQYRPVQFQGEEFNAILASRTDGVPMAALDMPDDDGLSDSLEDRRYAYTGDVGADLGLLYLPLPDLTVEDVREPLYKIDPDVNYVMWRELASALRHQFRREEDAQEAFRLFEEWSSTGSKHVEGEPYKKWISFRPDTTGGKAPITIRTLFRHAQAAGWNPKQVSDKLKQSVEEWIAACEDATELMEEGCRRIAAQPFANAIVEDHLSACLRARLKALTGNLIEKGAIKKQITAEKVHKKSEQQKGQPRPNWLSPWIYIATANVFRNATTGVEYPPVSFDNAFSIHLMPKTDAGDDEPSNGRPTILPTHYALNQLAIDRVDETLYYPLNGGTDPIVEVNGRRCLNTYNPSALLHPDPDTAEEAGALFTEHIGVVIAEPENRDLIIQFIAHNVQHPGKKIRWVPCIQSAEGVGKGTLVEILRLVMGANNVAGIEATVIRSQWNDWMCGHALVVLEEIHIPGEQREAVMNSLKRAISDDFVTINKRNTTARELPNYTNFIGFTNFIDALHLKPSDRRWGVFRSAIQTKEQVEILNQSGHFDRVAPLRNRLAAGLRHWLLNYPIPDTFPVNGPAPRTRYREEVIRQSRNATQASLEDLIDNEDYPLIGSDLIIETEVHTALGTTNDPQRASHYLRMLGFSAWNGGVPVRLPSGHRTAIWTHNFLFPMDIEHPEAVATERLEKYLR